MAAPVAFPDLTGLKFGSGLLLLSHGYRLPERSWPNDLDKRSRVVRR
jgi:hypothetical protein